ncbi:MAG TPA: FHA domain-containing protein [Thermoanaerobaculia bacterium]|nr:FHA domain-containing protein [Thermoanaerobaculia bacterium]
MIIQCPKCSAKYQYDEDRFERKPSKKIKCAKCQNVFEIHNPAFASRPEAGSTGSQDDTKMRKQKAAAEAEEAARVSEEAAAAEKEGAPLALPAGKRLSIAIIDGPDAGSVHRIEKPRVTIGRSAADIVINDGEASRQHAAIEVRETTYLLRDLGSKNGTLVDGRKVEGSVELLDKGEFQIGESTLMLIVTDDT